MLYIAIFALIASAFSAQPNVANNIVANDPKINGVFSSKSRFKISTASPPKIKLSDTPECADDIRHLCANSVLSNNFAVLDCLQNDKVSPE